MPVNQDQEYDHYTKVAWTIYTLAAAYVLRSNEKIMSKQILRFTGASKTTEQE